jgi:hypothetical protein
MALGWSLIVDHGEVDWDAISLFGVVIAIGVVEAGTVALESGAVDVRAGAVKPAIIAPRADDERGLGFRLAHQGRLRFRRRQHQ